MQMPHRRKTALAAFALVLAPVLSSCGFSNATDRDYTPGVGANNRDGEVDVLAGVIVADDATAGSGVFVASFSNNNVDDPITVEAMRSESGATFSGLEPIELAPEGFHNLATTESPVQVNGDFDPGNFVPVTVSFSNGEDISLKVPVVNNCGDYASVAGLPDGPELCPSGNDLEKDSEH
ncbi:hypothetical protein [Nocardioides gilvus]|uniref:hypothetical protein n=1 Tax=Nocardioides gilvus TaxID=1735589 RepID=UPI000D749167|nr:hypothetical protein [Nocardioides gilvus]